MLPWKLRKCQILPVNQNLSSVYFSYAKFQLVSCDPSLAIIWQMTYTHKLPKLCSATLICSERDVDLNITRNVVNYTRKYSIKHSVSLDIELFLVKLDRNTYNCLGTIPIVHCAPIMRL